MSDKKKRKRNLHVNMLKPWHSPVAAVMIVTVPDEEDADSDLITPHSDPGGTFTTDPPISTDQRQHEDYQPSTHQMDLGSPTLPIPSNLPTMLSKLQCRWPVQTSLCDHSTRPPPTTDGSREGGC